MIRARRGRSRATSAQRSYLRVGSPATTSNRHDASTTSMGPLATPVVERGQYIVRGDIRRSTPGPCSATLSVSGGKRVWWLASQQFRDRDVVLAALADERGVNLVIDVANLYGLGHTQKYMRTRMLSFKLGAPLVVRWVLRLRSGGVPVQYRRRRTIERRCNRRGE